jgi:hypothetical protein
MEQPWRNLYNSFKEQPIISINKVWFFYQSGKRMQDIRNDIRKERKKKKRRETSQGY